MFDFLDLILSRTSQPLEQSHRTAYDSACLDHGVRASLIYPFGGSGTGPILLSQASFLLAHIANSGPVPLSAALDFGPTHSHGMIFTWCEADDWGLGGLKFSADATLEETIEVVADPGDLPNQLSDVFVQLGREYGVNTKAGDGMTVEQGGSQGATITAPSEGWVTEHLLVRNGDTLTIKATSSAEYTATGVEDEHPSGAKEIFHFNLTLSPPVPPTVQINGPGQADNITLYDPATDEHPAVVQRATATVSNITQPVTLSVTSTGKGLVTFANARSDGTVLLDPGKGGSNQTVQRLQLHPAEACLSRLLRSRLTQLKANR